MSTFHSLKSRRDILGWGFTKNTRGVTNYFKIVVGLVAYSGPHKKNSGKASWAWVRKAGYPSALYTEFTEEQLLATVSDSDVCQFNLTLTWKQKQAQISEYDSYR